jgi:raffinose/stachyose/melibiose transport system permease protein
MTSPAPSVAPPDQIRDAKTIPTGSSTRPRRRPVEGIYWLLLFPAVAVFSLLITYPAVEGILMSFTNSIGFGDFEWIGVRNYVALFQDENIISSYTFTFGFATATVLLVNLFAFFLALGLTARIRFVNPLRAVFVVPMVISAIIYSFVFRFLFNNTLPEIGTALGIDFLSSSMLANESWAWLAIVIVTTWGSVPSAMLIYIAGLMTVPGEVYEASSIDGASPWQNLRHITLPLVVGYIGINMIIGFKNYLSVYDQIVGLTDGGPGTATRSVAFTIFSGFSGGDYAYQMANAAVFFAITIVIAVLQLRLTRGRAAK